ALVVGGTDTSSRHWSPASPFPVPHSREPGPGSPEVKARRTTLVQRPIPGCVVAVQGQHLQQSSSSSVVL
ncbi:hypothetical protein Taro_023146, partial [Colocasia esculenta]|nr:hypothetical protein [Colocasia esculenta]